MNNKTKKKTSKSKTSAISKKVNVVNKTSKLKINKKKLKPIIIVDYIFIISIIFTIIFGIQTNTSFFTPFVIVLIITIVCMGIILVNAVYSIIKKKINKAKNKEG